MTRSKQRRFSARVELKDGQRRGVLHIYDAVGGWDGIRAKDVVAKLEALKDEGAQHLDVHMNSPGGEVFEGMAIHSAIAAWPTGEKRIHVDGLCASAASLIAMAGDQIEISPVGMMMVHAPRGVAIGQATDMRKMAERLEAIGGVMVDTYAKRTGLAKSDVEQIMKDETWLNAHDAVAKGFADRVKEGPAKEDDDEEGEEGEPGMSAASTFAQAVAQFQHPPVAAMDLLGLPRATERATEQAVAQLAHAKEKDMGAEDLKAINDKLAALTAQVEAGKGVTSEFLAATGKPTTAEALAVVAGLKERAAKADELAVELAKRDAQLATIATERKAADIKALFEEATKDGRLAPAKRAELEKPEAPAFAKDPVSLRAFLECLPKAVVTVETLPGKTEDAPGASAVAQLTDLERQAAEARGLDTTMVALMKSDPTGKLFDEEYKRRKAAAARS
jgi:ATP-dependent Clp protease protease subunit